MSQTTVLNYRSKFIHFIKSCLINTCFTEYCKKVYSVDQISRDEYMDLLLSSKPDTELWDSVFNKVPDLFHYYLHLSTNYQSVLPDHDAIIYSQQQTSNTYYQLTFQEYIDEFISYEKQGYREYRRFIRSMEDTHFRTNLFQKYKRDSEERALKNYLIYVIQLYISKYVDNSTIFSNDEQEDMDTIMNAIPYFEYLAENNISMDDIQNDTMNINYNDMKQTNFLELQWRVFKMINTML